MRLQSASLSLILVAYIVILAVLAPSAANGEAPTIVPTTPDHDDSSSSITTPSALSFLKDCRRAGFDPMQLACTTCSILPKRNQGKCRDCCQSYKTLEKQSKRYEMAVMINTGYPEAVSELIREDLEKIHEQKGSGRFHILESVDDRSMGMGMMGLMFRQTPSVIFWFEKSIGIDDLTTDMEQLEKKADEATVISGRGLGRDDIRDMLLALLPDDK